MTRRELIKELQNRGVEKVYGKSLSSCAKYELESYLEQIQKEFFELSYTQVRMFRKCGLQYYFRYVKGLKIPPSASKTLGTTVSKTLDFALEEKQRGRLAQISELHGFFDETFEELKDETDWREEDPEEYRSAGKNLTGLYHEKKLPEVEPFRVQPRLELPFEFEGFKLVGYPDLIERDWKIVDHKVSSRILKKQALDRDLQLTFYSMLVQAHYGGRKFDVSWHCLIQKKQPEFFELRSERFNRDLIRAERILSRTLSAIRSKNFVPAPEDAWWCSPDWCGYWQLCQEEL